MLRKILKNLRPFSQFNRNYVASSNIVLNNSLDQVNQELIQQTYNSIKSSFLAHNLSKSKKIIQPILENFLAFTNKSLLSKLIANPNEWALFFNTDSELKNFIHLMIIEAISSEQNKLNDAEFYLNLSDSLTNYLNSININETNIHFGYLKIYISIYCTYLEQVVLNEKKPPQQIDDLKFKQKLDKLETYLKHLMKRYKNFDELSILDKDMFIKAFSFFETKWSYSTKLLMEQPFELNALYTQSNFSNCLKGAIRFNQSEIFHQLFVKLNKWNLNGNINSAFYPSQTVFKEYFYLKSGRNSNIDKDLNDLFNAWRVSSYVPSRQVVDYLKENNNMEQSYQVIETKLNSRGICKVTGKQIARKVFNKNELDKVANLVRDYMLLETKNEKFLNSSALDEFDSVLKKSKFDVIIDGMNVYYHNRQPRLKNIVSMVELLKVKMNKQNVLVLLKDHLKSQKVYAKLAEVNPNVKCFYIESESSEEDKFVIYASLKAATHIISNDMFTNFICRLNGSYDTFKQWLTNRRIEYRIPFNYSNNIKLKMPPVYEMKSHQVSEHGWFIPYFELEKKSNFETPNNWIYVEKKQ